MATFDLEFPEDLLGNISESECDELFEEMLKAAAPIYVESMQASMKQVIEHDGDSDMVNSVKATKPKKTKTDAHIINVGPSGYSTSKYYYGSDKKGGHYTRKYPVSNALKAIWKEYGIPGRQVARPWLVKAKNTAESKCLSAMQEVYNKRMGEK